MTDATVILNFRVVPELRDKIDALAEANSLTRSEALRLLIERATAEDLVPEALREPETEVAE